ncbi:MAG: polysaccharide deacetylase family protein [Ruminococcus sp.]|nr:polysaccharide deacetylase family protein [Ruminococcus sp.]
MYKCFRVKKLIIPVIIILCIIFFFMGRKFFSVAYPEEKPVKLPVIMYHSIYADAPSEYAVTPVQIENDLKWLSDNGYTAVSAQQLCDYVFNDGTLPEKCVMITLDDGYYNNTTLLPLLEKYDMCAVVSIVGKYTDEYAAKDPHNLNYSYLTWEDVNELLNSGRVEIGNHTYDMHSLYNGRKGCAKNAAESESEYISALSADISLMQEKIRENTGISSFVFAYPFGAVSPESRPVLRENGFLVTFICRELPNYITRDPKSLLGIGRYNRSGFYSTEEFMKIINS